MPRLAASSNVPSMLVLTLDKSVQFTPAGEGEDKKLARFSLVAYSGGPAVPYGWGLPVITDLAGMKFASPMPVLMNHRLDQSVGHVTHVDADSGKIRVDGVVSGTGPQAREVVENAQNGFPWQVSIGAEVHKVIRVDDGERVTVNGRTFSGPVYVARSTTLREVSFTPVGADQKTSAKIAASFPLIGVIPMSFEKWLKAKGFDPALLSEEQESILRQTYDAEQAVIAPGVDKPKPDVTQTGPVEPNHVDPKPAAGELRQAADIGDPIAQMRQQAAAELRRVEAVRKICKGDAELASKAIEQGWTPERAELEVFRLARPTAPAIHANGGGPANPRVLEAALRLGSSEPEARLVQEYGAETLEAAYPLRRIGLQGLIRACCAMDGAETPRLGAGEGELAQAGFSTASLPTILGNTANKVLLAAYRSVPSVARVIAKKLTATDFKEHTGVRLTGDSTMLKVGQDGELKFGAMNEGTFTYSVDTYGRIFGITRQMIRNDDLGAFLDIPALIGRGSGLAIEKTLFALLLANTGDFFHGDNANYISGATTALGYESLGKAIQKLLKQVDADGNPINLMGKYLVVPPELFDIAQEIFKANAINTGGAATTEKIAAANIHAGKYEPLVSPYLSAAGMTGYSTTAWYLFGDPADVPAFGIAYLDGVETPVIEDAPLQSDILGKAWRGYIDFGVCQIDHRGAVKSKGAA